ncbi:MAG: DUF5793 family protein [Halodesulfurarchaeum sp.]
MRRDYFALEAKNVDWVEEEGEPQLPTVRVDFQGPETDLREGFRKPDGEFLSAEETDISFRLQGDIERDDEAGGVVAVTNRVTGDFIFELNVSADDVLRFVNAARRYAEETEDASRYKVEIYLDGEEFVTYEKETFLVYNQEGDLLRSRSLIPGGVEL